MKASSQITVKHLLTDHWLEAELNRRKKHLAKWLTSYKRVLALLYGGIIKPAKPFHTGVFFFKYHNRPRLITLGIGWAPYGDYPRTSGFVCLHRGTIIGRSDIITYPKTQVLTTPTLIDDMSDDEIVKTLLTCMGAPFAQEVFPDLGHTGAVVYEANSAAHHIENLVSLAPPRYFQEIEDLRARMMALTKRVLT